MTQESSNSNSNSDSETRQALTFGQLKKIITDHDDGTIPDDMEVWIEHPEAGIQWGPVYGAGVGITDRFQYIFIFDTMTPEGQDEDQELPESESPTAPGIEFSNAPDIVIRDCVVHSTEDNSAFEAQRQYHSDLAVELIGVIDRMRDLTSPEEAVRLCNELVHRTDPIFEKNFNRLMESIKHTHAPGTWYYDTSQRIDGEVDRIKHQTGLGLAAKPHIDFWSSQRVRLHGVFSLKQVAGLYQLMNRIDPEWSLV